MALNLGPITPEMMKTLEEATVREEAFFMRHGLECEAECKKTGFTSEAHRSWVKSVEHEYKLMGKESRVHLDTPLARKAYVLGYKRGMASVPRAESHECSENKP